MMNKCVFVTNLPSPYRVDFFNHFGKFVDLTVVYERKSSSERDSLWVSKASRCFKECYAPLKPYKADQSTGCGLIKIIKKNNYDFLIISNYASPSVLRLILWCILHKKDYYLEYDGGFDKKDNFLKHIIKKILICNAKGHFASSSQHIKYLTKLGVKENTIFKYNFSSVKEEDIISKPLTCDEKITLRKKCGLSCRRMVLSIGQFIYRKGFDLLIRAASLSPRDIDFFIVGGNPTNEYLNLIKEFDLTNVHFIPFREKEDLVSIYKCADLFVMPTREDIWGLVINEAMANGLPVISSNKCIAAIEMVKEGCNGFIYQCEDVADLAHKIEFFFSNPLLASKYSEASLETIKNYTIEKMAFDHYDFLNK